MSNVDESADWTNEVEFVEPADAAAPLPPAPGLDAIMAALAAIVDELKRVADGVEVLGGLLEEGRGTITVLEGRE